MSAGRDFLLFVLFLVALGIAWFFTGGPGRTISHAGWFLNPGSISIPSVLGSTTTLPNAETSTWQFENGTGGENGSGGSNQTQVYRPGFGYVTPPPASPYAQYVYIGGSDLTTANASDEYIEIGTDGDLPGTLTISGWTLVSPATGISATIGDAAQIPFLGQVNAEGPVSVGPNATVFITTGRSPNGASFRLNECTGYFEQFQNFSPGLPAECPLPDDEFQNAHQLAGDDACEQYVENLDRCTLQVNALPAGLGGLCQNFILNTLTYNGCITAHEYDPGFYRKEWRLFLGRDQELWKNTHDTIWLLDENGKLVAETNY